MEAFLRFLAKTQSTYFKLYGTNRFLLILVLASLLISPVFSTPINLKQDAIRHPSNKPTIQKLHHNRVYTMENKCSLNLVKFTEDKGIRADHGTEDKNAEYHLEFRDSVDSGRDEFHIKRRGSEKYICFNKKGRLRIRRKPSSDGRCTFTEERLDSSPPNQGVLSRYRSVTHGRYTWYLGFNPTGDPIPGYMEAYKETDGTAECFQFRKHPVKSSQYSSSQSSNSVESPDSSEYLTIPDTSLTSGTT